MRDVGVVAFAQSDCLAANRRDDMADILAPVIAAAVAEAGIDRSEIDFYCSGSHDFHEGRTFAYIESLDAVGAWPPISESHVEMDAAWAVTEAWSWLQLGEGDLALVYGIGRGSLARDLDQVSRTMLDPYYLAPLSPPRHALAGIQAQALLATGRVDETDLAATVARSLADAESNRHAQRSGRPSIEELLAAPYVAAPLREHDCAPVGDAAAVLILAAGDRARELCERPAWIRAMDHRIDSHYPGSRDLTRLETVEIAASRASAMAGFGPGDVDVAELHTEYSYAEPLLATALGLGPDVVLNPSGGPLAGNPTTATGLIRIGEAAARIRSGSADRALAHATSGPALQHNLVSLMEGDG
ncbi:lipid-transfer protein [Nocardioides sp. GY 10113]|uniref:lipid-transfer protein n=1 Tax=Nocardioides sp. GY 10113 TaxID=2569761 RepID=UPI0010A86E38|nr:lipid-transfer protein [Nocardioides sp. GY 10113]TIC88553.1 lipid-transfer protein [Nocardioides sp. GY 10113]